MKVFKSGIAQISRKRESGKVVLSKSKKVLVGNGTPLTLKQVPPMVISPFG
jgi:hypothetical protein